MLTSCSNRSIQLALVLACGCLAGCGGEKKGHLPTAQVTGQVSYQGKPLSHGTIKFIPVHLPGKETRVAYGILDAKGRYSLSTYGRSDGAAPGNYQVAVESREEPPADAEVVRHITKPGQVAVQQTKSLIPERYGDPIASGLTAQVGAGSNAIDFELKD